MEFVWLAVGEEGTGRATLIDGTGSRTLLWNGPLDQPPTAGQVTELQAVLDGRPVIITGADAGPWENACTLVDLAALAVPGAFDPYRTHGLAEGDHAGLADALFQRLDRLDTGLVELAALLIRGANPALGRFLTAVAEAMLLDGRPVRPALEWIEPHDRNEKPPVNRTPVPLDVAAVTALLGPDGPMARAMPGYEPRPSQIDVAQRMTEALNRNRHLLMEAPTGTGKSLAYLIPAAAWAGRNEERVLVATHTIALQEQLLAKDLPLLEQILERPVRAAVVKGRSNYICLRKWEEAAQGLSFQSTDAEAEFLARIAVWLGQTSTGDRAEVLRGREDSQRWDAIASETATCIGARCKWFAKHCFAHRVRREATQAEVLITNHALLCAQLRQGNQGFPAFGRVIVDEAHQLEAVATAAFTSTCSLDELQIALTQLNNSVMTGTLGDGALQRWSRKIGRPFTPDLNGLAFPPGRDLFDLLGDVSTDARRVAGEVRSHLYSMASSKSPMVRLTPAVWQRQGSLRDSLIRLGRCLAVLIMGLQQILEALADRDDEAGAAQVRGRLPLFEEGIETLRGVIAGKEEQVAWAEADREVVLQVAPLYPGARLREKLFDAYPTVALVSATLTVGGSFDYALRSLGPDPARVDTAVVESPFAWKEQALLLVADDAPTPRGTSDPAYVQGLTETLGQLLPAVGGQTLVLFTANAVLKETLQGLQVPMRAQGIELLGQGIDGTPSQLVDRLKHERNVVVFGSGSFWEGVDVPGEALSCLIITRLPFRPPDVPVAMARAEQEQKQGRDPFASLSLPEAVIRFRQGFGRLIRTRTDRGVVIVLDGRILPGNSTYADLFLSSLPPISRVKGRVATVLRRTREWLGRPD